MDEYQKFKLVNKPQLNTKEKVSRTLNLSAKKIYILVIAKF